MKNLSTYLLVMFVAMFWVFRVIVAFCSNIGVEFMVQPYDFTFEIVLLFLTLVTTVLIAKRNMLGAVIYLIGYWLYFGATLLNIMSKISEGATMNSYVEILVAGIGIILPLAVLIDTLLDKNRKANPVDKKTDWFYKNKDYDRQFDERADRNEYKF